MSGRRYSIVTESEAETLLQSRLDELEKLQQIEKLTSRMSSLLLILNEQLSNVQTGTASVAKITGNWIQIVRAVSLAANSMMVYKDEEFKTGVPTTERLVRCALDDLSTIINELKEDDDSQSQ